MLGKTQRRRGKRGYAGAAEVVRSTARGERVARRERTRILTVIWAITWLGEFALRVILVYTLSIEQILIVGAIIFNTITFGLIAATRGYVRRARARQASPGVDARLQAVEGNPKVDDEPGA